MSARTEHDEPSPIEGALLVIVAALVMVLAALAWTEAEPETVDDFVAPRAVCVPGHTGCPR